MKKAILAIALLAVLPACSIRHASDYNHAHRYYNVLMLNYLKNPATYSAYWSESDVDKKKAIRNRVMDYCIYLSDDSFSAYEVKFSNGNVAINLTADLAGLGTAGAASVAASKVMAAITTGILGAKAAYNGDVLEQQTKSVIILKMESLRRATLARIRAGENQSVADYSLERGLIDIQDYVNAGTVHSALSDIAKDSSK